MIDFQQAVDFLHQGKIIAFPTETVYGLGADAKNESALQKIFKVKGRPSNHPLIVHLSDISELSDWAIDMPDSVYSLGKAFWPGPLTLILKKSRQVSDWVTGGQETIGIRIPKHPMAQILLKQFGGGIAAPSANRFGRISATTASAVREELSDTVDLILDGGQCPIGIESTILDMTASVPALLRPGEITKDEIVSRTGIRVVGRQKDSPRVSGSLVSHYAPRTLTKIINSIEDFLNNLKEDDLPCALLVRKTASVRSSNTKIDYIFMSNDPQQYAHDLYHTLRLLDKKQYRQLIIEALPDTSSWDSVRDRLIRATATVTKSYCP